MSNIDFLKQDIQVGDIATIELTSGKSVQGEVLEIGEYVLLKKDDGKSIRLLDGIIGGWELVESPKLSHLGNSLDALKSVYVDSEGEENSKLLPPMGRIKYVSSNYAFVVDEQTKSDVYVPAGELLDKSITHGAQVVYSYGKNAKGPAARAVHKATSVSEALALAYSLSEAGQHRKAIQVLRHVLDIYPQNVSASRMIESIRGMLFSKKEERKTKTSLNKSDKSVIGDSPSVAMPASDPIGPHPEKPRVITDPKTKEALPLDLPKMTDVECREKERQLDLLIRNGERERCLEISYQLLSQRCPTPKYLRSYLDRIANTEVALNHTSEAISALAELIYFSESQPDIKASNLSHLYVFLARLLYKQNDVVEAEKALNCAEFLGSNNNVIQSLREQIQAKVFIDDQQHKENKDYQQADNELKTAFTVSKMLQQDVEQTASSMSSEGDPEQFLSRAFGESAPSSNKTFEVKAQFFLEAAACYLLRKEDSKDGYKRAVANYARMKGNAMFARLQNSIHSFPENKNELLAFSDSACSYYTEALGIYNDLKQPKYLQELFLKYLKLRRVSSQILGGKTPDSEWASGTLKALLQECLKGDDSEDFKVFVYTCVSIGASTEAAWNSLSSDDDGISPFMGRLSDPSFRERTFKVFNDIEGSDIPYSLKVSDFLHQVFNHRQQRNEELYAFLSDISQWEFDPIVIAEVSGKWGKVNEYLSVLLPSDERTCSSISNVINILTEYVEGDTNYRNNLLIQAQQVIQKSLKEIAETTTYLGRVFFSPLESRWLDRINERLSHYYASKEPRLRILPDPATIRHDELGYYVVFRVLNVGETPATSFRITVIDHHNQSWPSIDNERLSVREEKVIKLQIPEPYSSEIERELRLPLTIEATPLYQGRTLESTSDVFVFEVESSIPLERKDMPWIIEATPPDNIFKGRDKDLTKLVSHYKSRERGHTYILYGLTRTGKSSMLEYLRGRLKGVALDDNPGITILPFSWDFNNVAFDKKKEDQFWEHLVKTRIYQTLPDELKQAVNKSYDTKSFPTVVSQNDFLRIIDILNDNRYHPFITIDEFSNVKDGIEDGMLNAAFLGVLRDLALTGKASFIYAGTYDIKDLPKDPKYGYTGQLAHTRKMPINAIKEKYADELIDASDKLHFENEAKSYIRYLSGCVPYWIQWICLNCGKYAIIQQKHFLGVHDVDEVVKIMTGEARDEDEKYTWERLDEINFQNNQVMTDGGKQAEEALISSIAYLNRNNLRHARGISTKELDILWDNNHVSKTFQGEMMNAIKRMKERSTLIEETEDGRLVYRLSVDLFRRCWYVNHKNISTELAHK